MIRPASKNPQPETSGVSWFSLPALPVWNFRDGPDENRPCGRERVAAIQALGVFDDAMYFHEVYQPILTALGVTRPELRRAA